MIGVLARRLFGSANDRVVKRMATSVAAITAFEPELKALDDPGLRAKTAEFKEKLAHGAELDDLLPEAFAVVREAAVRTLGQRHFDVQLMGGMVLHEGKIAEMKTGEGKTLVATLPVYLNALAGKGVHVVTVNDYLARRDAAWMGQIYGFLGMSVGVIVPGLDDAARRQAYAADITYGTNNEYGFDYLRDNMKMSRAAMVQRGHQFGIVDEVDSILVDEARTPLIISGPAEDSSALYRKINEMIPTLTEDDYEIDLKHRSASFSESGAEKLETWLRAEGLLKGEVLFDVENVTLVHHANQALRAAKLFQRDRDYLIKNDKVIIVDEHTGRMMEGRRWSDGLHQAVEAKEEVAIQAENQTLASITFQNYFRMYGKLAGMTGTAATEAAEFESIYGLRVVEIPTHMDMIRKDEDDEVYRSEEEKFEAILDEIADAHGRGQPILVGTVSIEKSERVAERLHRRGIAHHVLNARYHEQEAVIIAQAGRLGGVTIATNMAGRGTDIQLGGNLEMRVMQEVASDADEATRAAAAERIRAEVEAEKAEVLKAGGLYVVGTERHESRRIDNQLRGRSGRQGDPGRSKFFLSIQDDLMKRFGSERMDGMLQRLGLKEGEAIVHPWINKALEKAQQKVEALNFDMRKQLLKYDDVMNDQRKVVYEQRLELMEANDVSDTVSDMRDEAVRELVRRCIPEKAYPEQWDVDTLAKESQRLLGITADPKAWAQEEGIAEAEIEQRLIDESDKLLAQKAATYGPDVMRMAEKSLLLQIFDHLWKEHLLHLDQLRSGIHLRGYGQKDPLNEYKREAFVLFDHMLGRLRETVTQVMSHLEIRMPAPQAPAEAGAHAGNGATEAVAPSGNGQERMAASASAAAPADDADQPKVGRNASCPCGSGRKYKHCHGRLN